MNRIMLLGILLCAAGPAWAIQSSTNMGYQGKLLSPTGVPQNGNFNICFAVYNAATGAAGTCPRPGSVWTETISNVPVTNGVFAVQLGNVTPLPAQVFASSPTYLGIGVGADNEMTPRQLLSGSPYAYAAAQLVSNGAVQLNAGVAYATFTAAGNLQLPYGVTAASATFSSTVTVKGQDAATGYSLQLSSGLVMVNGTLYVNIVQALTGVFTAAGPSLYSLATSSGILMNGGTLRVAGGGGINAMGTGILATTGTFAVVAATGTNGYSIVSSSGIDMNGGTLALDPSSRGLYASGTGVVATTVTLSGSSSDPTGGTNGMMAYNTTSQRFRCYENGAWTNCVRRPESISLGGYLVLTNVGANYDTTAISSGMGTGYADFTNATSVDFVVRVNKVGTGTQSWQLYDSTNGVEIGVINDAGAAGQRVLTANFSSGLPSGVVIVRVRAKSTTAADDPVFFGAGIMINK